MSIEDTTRTLKCGWPYHDIAQQLLVRLRKRSLVDHNFETASIRLWI